MVSLRFPFSSFSQPPRRPQRPKASSRFSPSIAAAAAAAAASVGIGVGVAVSLKSGGRSDPSLQKPWGLLPSPAWASLSLSDGAAGMSVEPKTGVTFPSVLDGSRRLLGVGVRRKNVFGLKNIDVYAFGIYADDSDIRKLSEKYGMLTASELKDNKELVTDVLDQDLRMTVRLQIVYSRLSIRSVRSAFEESVGNRLQKFSGSENKELLQGFASLFKDEYKIPRGSVIDLSREQGYILQTKINGKEVGSIHSKLLCQSIFDLYVGEDSFDKKASEDFKLGLASLLQS